MKQTTKNSKMFGTLAEAQQFQKSQKLSQLENLGPVLEKLLNNIGIYTMDDLKRVGWQLVVANLMKKGPRFLLPFYSYILIGALANQVWTNISEQDKAKAKKYVLGLTEKIRPKKKKITTRKKPVQKKRV